MSYDPRMAASGRYGVPDSRDRSDSSSKKGSVRAARERVQGGQPAEVENSARRIGLPSRPNQLVSQFSGGHQQQQGPGSSSSSPSPQWPLPRGTEDTVESGYGQYQQPPTRGPPPQRPPRPTSDDIPSDPSISHARRPSYRSDETLSPTDGPSHSRPLTTSSSASTSSLGSIPDFPVPEPPMPTVQQLQQLRRNPSLGPPPSARRGPSSYYTQMSYVSPIAEESETRSETIRSLHGSFASSNVFPANPDNRYYVEDDGVQFESDEETAAATSENGRGSRGSDREERGGLVRQASLGRRTKPHLTTIKSSDSVKEGTKPSAGIKRKPVKEHETAIGKVVGGGGAMVVPREQPSITSLRQSPGPSASLNSGTGLLDPSSSSSAESLPLQNPKSRNGTNPSSKNPSPTPDQQRAEAQAQNHSGQSTRQNTLADRVGNRRPPKINVDAVREAEARGSLTSLPDLIKRATRLAANLDRGKTASRFGLDFWEFGGQEKGARRSGSLSDMLAAFPPPGEATPTGDNTPNRRGPGSRWPSGGGFQTLHSARTDEKSERRRRRCCGMPMWTFVTLLIVLLFLVAAAVIIPIVLIVIPRMRDTNTTTPSDNNGSSNSPAPNVPVTPPPPGQCDGIIRCQNGGVAVPNADGSCNCVCINGFTGKTCSTASSAGCTTINVPDTASNATVGASIPRLLSSAQQNFSIPLDTPALLTLFSNLSLSCTAENALITFNGVSLRSVEEALVPLFVRSALESLSFTPQPDRRDASEELERRQQIGEAATPSPTASDRATPTATPTASATPSPVAFNPRNRTALDFARTSILLVLQEERDMNVAAGAQENIQNFINNGNRNNRGTAVQLGNGYTIDLVAFTLDLGNGTTIQANPPQQEDS